MRKVLQLATLFLLAAFSAQAQSIQTQLCQATITCAYKNPTQAGDLLVAVGQANGWSRSAAISSSGNETWAGVPIYGWTGGYIVFWYGTANGGSDTITLPVTSDIVIAEYPPAVFDSLGMATGACCQGSTINVGPVTTTGAVDILFVWAGLGGSSTLAAGPGFTLTGNVGAVGLESENVSSPGVYSGSMIMTPGATDGAGLIAFKLVTPPPPPPPPVTLTVTGTLLFDDETAVASGIPILVQQQNSQGTYVQAGSVVSDSAGNLTGSVTIDPNQVNKAGFLTIQFGISGLPLGINQNYPVQEFQQSSTGVNLSLVLFKSVMLPKSFSVALVP